MYFIKYLSYTSAYLKVKDKNFLFNLHLRVQFPPICSIKHLIPSGPYVCMYRFLFLSWTYHISLIYTAVRSHICAYDGVCAWTFFSFAQLVNIYISWSVLT